MRLKETTVKTSADPEGRTITADIEDINVTGTAPHGVRFSYLDAEDEPKTYQVAVEYPNIGNKVPQNVAEADIVVLHEKNAVVALTEVEK